MDNRDDIKEDIKRLHDAVEALERLIKKYREQNMLRLAEAYTVLYKDYKSEIKYLTNKLYKNHHKLLKELE